jgi:hypothetical protein
MDSENQTAWDEKIDMHSRCIIVKSPTIFSGGMGCR